MQPETVPSSVDTWKTDEPIVDTRSERLRLEIVPDQDPATRSTSLTMFDGVRSSRLALLSMPGSRRVSVASDRMTEKGRKRKGTVMFKRLKLRSSGTSTKRESTQSRILGLQPSRCRHDPGKVSLHRSSPFPLHDVANQVRGECTIMGVTGTGPFDIVLHLPLPPDQ
jgi:hypothetical protein